jgi:type II secretory pathway predicted ATPase ExeA
MGINEPSISAEKRQYYSSSHGPFHNANNILMFFGGGDRGLIVETIMRSLRLGDRLITVGGERGSGKTMMSLVLADRLKHRHNIIRYDLPQLTPALLLRHLLIEICPQKAAALDLDVNASGLDINAAFVTLSGALAADSPGNKPYLLTVDSHADVDQQTLQIMQDLVAGASGVGQGLQIILFRRTLSGKRVSQEVNTLAGFNAANMAEDHYWLRRLTLNEINEYLRHHMMLFDFNQRDMFTREMAYFVADRSEGIFRPINTLARNGFMLASLEDAEKVSMSHLLAAGLPEPEPPIKTHGFMWRHRAAMMGLLGTSILATIALVIAIRLG